MILNTNQNRQFYVVKEVVTKTPSNLGEVQVGTTQEGEIFFKHYGEGGLTRTDLIPVDQICYARHTTKEEMTRYAKKAVIKLAEEANNGELITGQDYILRIQISNYLAPSDANIYVKAVAVHATRAMKKEGVEAFYKKMAELLEKNFSREEETLFSFGYSATGLTITEKADQPWRLGAVSQEAVNFEVYPAEITVDGDSVVWGEVEYSEDKSAPIKNGKKVADMEYFCSAERGDMFRNMGWPNNIDVKFMVDPAKEYDLLDVHYFYSGNGVQVHKSEKDITFAVPSDSTAMDKLKDCFTEQGITVAERKEIGA